MKAAPQNSGWRPRVLVTRAASRSSVLAEELRQLGADPLVIPTIQIVPPDSFSDLDLALRNPGLFDWVIFTSATAVDFLHSRAEELNLPPNFASAKISAIGAATAASLEQAGHHVDLVPEKAIAESLAEALRPFARKPDGAPSRFLLIRAQEGRDHLPNVLREAGGDVTIAAAYKTSMPAEAITTLRALLQDCAHQPDGLTLASSSAATNFFDLLAAAGLALPPETAIASIGPFTSATLRKLGRPPDVEAPVASVKVLAKTIVEYLQNRAREQSSGELA